MHEKITHLNEKKIHKKRWHIQSLNPEHYHLGKESFSISLFLNDLFKSSTNRLLEEHSKKWKDRAGWGLDLGQGLLMA